MTETPTPPVRVFLADDHEVVRDALMQLLSAVPGFEVVGQAGTAAPARSIGGVRAGPGAPAPPEPFQPRQTEPADPDDDGGGRVDRSRALRAGGRHDEPVLLPRDFPALFFLASSAATTSGGAPLPP